MENIIDFSKMGKDCYHDFKIALKDIITCCCLVIKGQPNITITKGYEDLNDEDLKKLHEYSNLLGELAGKLFSTAFLCEIALTRHNGEVNNDNIQEKAK